MPAGPPPENRFLPRVAGETEEEYTPADDVFHAHAERLIQEAMRAGEFDDLRGAGRPIPGAGTVDDEMWWVRSWLRRNQDRESPYSG